MKYMLVIYGNHDAWSSLDQADIDRIGVAHKLVQSELAATGELVDHKELALDEAKNVRSNDGDLVITNGPFAEAKQILGGYYVVDCANLDRATEIASQFIESDFAPIEVRRLKGDSSWDTTTPGA